jgi:DNA-binding HxlR family transcriptional regulator
MSVESEFRSGCPINLTLRDLMFGNRRRYRELLTQSEEGIATNILADRLKRLVEAGLLSRAQDPNHKQGGIYSLTEPAIRLVPMIVQMGAWGRRHTLASPDLSIRAQLLEEGGPALWDAFMTELRHLHLGAPKPKRSVVAELTEAYLREAEKLKKA